MYSTSSKVCVIFSEPLLRAFCLQYSTRDIPTMSRLELAPMCPNSRPGSQLSNELKDRIIVRHLGSQSAAKIARDERLPASTVRSLISRWKERDTTNNKPRSGRPPITTPRERRAIVRAARNNPQMPLESIQKVAGVPHSRSTIKRVLHDEGLLHWRSKQRLELTERHAADRLAWALQHQDTDWSK
jgi:transposase